MILFFMSLFLLNNSFLWLKAFLAISILVLISVSHLPSLVMRAPMYLNRSTCSKVPESFYLICITILLFVVQWKEGRDYSPKCLRIKIYNFVAYACIKLLSAQGKTLILLTLTLLPFVRSIFMSLQSAILSINSILKLLRGVI